MSPFTSECYLSRLYAVKELLSNENQESSLLRPPMHLINSPHLCYTRSNTENGDYYGKPLRLQWRVGNGALYIDYGNVAAPRELRNVYVSHGRMTGTLYIDGFYFGDVELYMQ